MTVTVHNTVELGSVPSFLSCITGSDTFSCSYFWVITSLYLWSRSRCRKCDHPQFPFVQDCITGDHLLLLQVQEQLHTTWSPLTPLLILEKVDHSWSPPIGPQFISDHLILDHSWSPPITAGRLSGVRQVLHNHLLFLLVLAPPRPVRVAFQTEALLDRLLEHPRLPFMLCVFATSS